MACGECQQSNFWEKLGRCTQCMWQLSVVSVLGWSAWRYFYRETPTQVESIALLFFCAAASILLLAHGIKYVYLKFIENAA
ncbi:DUF3624 domain-containing protein [Shewanella sp.]|uniref:DUF3624 domain-containing protein n=1 Tax=Shewanella sp. TaxID=50422 RepID=UPI0040549620